jgi:hypothetical protein
MRPVHEPAGTSEPAALDAWLLTDIVGRLRHVLRSSIRSDYPWETLPMAQVELLQRLRDEPGLRVNDLAARHRLANNTVSVLTQRLVVADLVARTEDPDDRQAVRRDQCSSVPFCALSFIRIPSELPPHDVKG